MKALLSIIAGLGGWAFGFSLLYAVHGIACARHWSAIPIGPIDAQRLTLVAVWLTACLALALWTRALFRVPLQAETPLIDWLARASATTGLVSMLVSGLPILATGQCDAPLGVMEPDQHRPVVQYHGWSKKPPGHNQLQGQTMPFPVISGHFG